MSDAVLSIRADTKQALDALKRLGAAVRGLGQGVSKAFGAGVGSIGGSLGGKLAAAASVAGVMATLRQGQQMAIEYVKASVRVRENLERIGLGGQFSGIERAVSQMEKATGFDDKQIMDLFGRVFEAGGRDVEDARRRVMLALDLEATGRIDAASALDALTRAGVEDYRMLSRLARSMGIAVDENTDYNEVVRKLHAAVGGIAERMQQASDGVGEFQVEFDNLKQDLGVLTAKFLGGAYKGAKDFFGIEQTKVTQEDLGRMEAGSKFWHSVRTLGGLLGSEADDKQYQAEMRNIQGWRQYLATENQRQGPSYQAPRVKADVQSAGRADTPRAAPMAQGLRIDIRSAPGIVTSARSRR